MTPKPTSAVIMAAAYTAAVLGMGYAAFGLVTMLVFTAGFLGGLLLWLMLPTRGTWSDVRVPFWVTMLLFLAHRVEEKQSGFFAMLSEVTGVPTPDATSPIVVTLVLFSVGGWLCAPWLMKHKQAVGQYFAWTFFASMGITELAHWFVCSPSSKEAAFIPCQAYGASFFLRQQLGGEHYACAATSVATKPGVPLGRTSRFALPRLSSDWSPGGLALPPSHPSRMAYRQVAAGR